MTSCACRLTPHGVSPAAHLGDGCADLILVAGRSRCHTLSYLFRTAFTGNAVSPLCMDNAAPITLTHQTEMLTLYYCYYYYYRYYCYYYYYCYYIVSDDGGVWPTVILLHLADRTSVFFPQLSLQHVTFHRAQEVVFTPKAGAAESSWNCDGELLTEPRMRLR